MSLESKKNISESEKARNTGKGGAKAISIVKVTYGKEELAKCMESVIKRYKNI